METKGNIVTNGDVLSSDFSKGNNRLVPYNGIISNRISISPEKCLLESCDKDVPVSPSIMKTNGDISAGNGSIKKVSITENPCFDTNCVTFCEDNIIHGDGCDHDSICSSSYSGGNDVDEDEDDENKPKVPDGGWGWVVVFASFMLSMIADGNSFSFGLLYVQFLKHFGESKSKTSWIGSLFMAVPLLSGPVGSALVDRYGCRAMTMLGGIIAGIGFVLSSFTDSIEMLFLTFGVVSGLGLGLCYVTAVVSIAYWFDKKRTLATGLGACGTGVGTFVFAPMTTYFIDEYGWRGTILLLSGTFFNMCVCGAVMRDPEWWTLEQNKSGALNKSIKTASSCGSVSGRSESDFPGVEELRKLMKSAGKPDYILTALQTSTDPPQDNVQTPLYSSVVNLPTYIKQSETVPLEVLESLSSNKRVFNVILENYPSLLMCRSLSDKGKLNAIEADLPTRVPVTMSMRVKANTKKSPNSAEAPLLKTVGEIPSVKMQPPVLKKSLNRADSLLSFKKQHCMGTPLHPSHYLKGIRVHRNSVMYRGAILNMNKYRLRASSCPDIYRNSMTTIAKETEEKWYSEILDLCKSMMDFSMFLELHFLLMSLSTILLFVWFIVPYFYLAEYVTRYNYSEQDASAMLSVVGLTNFVGMILLGWAGDQPWMDVTKTYAVCLIMCGVSTLGMPFFLHNWWLLFISCALFGLFFASSFSFTPVILVQLIPLERFTTAYGLILLCQGIGNLVGPPLAGFMYDATQSWELPFYMAGVWIVVSGVLIAAIPFSTNRRIWGSGPTERDSDRENDSMA